MKLCCSRKAPSTCGSMLQNDNIHCESQDCLCSDLYRMSITDLLGNPYRPNLLIVSFSKLVKGSIWDAQGWYNTLPSKNMNPPRQWCTLLLILSCFQKCTTVFFNQIKLPIVIWSDIRIIWPDLSDQIKRPHLQKFQMFGKIVFMGLTVVDCFVNISQIFKKICILGSLYMVVILQRRISGSWSFFYRYNVYLYHHTSHYITLHHCTSSSQG